MGHHTSPAGVITVSTDPERGDYVVDDETDDAAVVQRAYDDLVADVAVDLPLDTPIDPPQGTTGTVVLDPADRQFVFEAPLDIWQSRCRVTATGGPTIIPADGYTGPLVTSGLRPETAVGEDGIITDLVIENLWLNGRGRATGLKLNDIQLSTIGGLHVRNTGGPGLWIADGCIENLFSDIVLSDNCGSFEEPALLIRPVSESRPDSPSSAYRDTVGNITVNSTHFSGVMIHFPTNDALRISSGPTPVAKSRRHRKIQFTGCMFHSHGRAENAVVTIEDAYELAFVGTQMLLWGEEGTCVQLGTEDARWPVGSTTFSHCWFTAKQDSTVAGITCENVDTEITPLQAIGNTFDDCLAHAVDWGDQPNKRAAWAGNGVDTHGEAHVGRLPEDADVSPFH